jgi:hypothetical protein
MPPDPRTSENPLGAKFGEFRTSEVRRAHFHAVTRYSALCAAHLQGERTSENSVKAKFAEFCFSVLGRMKVTGRAIVSVLCLLEGAMSMQS